MLKSNILVKFVGSTIIPEKPCPGDILSLVLDFGCTSSVAANS